MSADNKKCNDEACVFHGLSHDGKLCKRAVWATRDLHTDVKPPMSADTNAPKCATGQELRDVIAWSAERGNALNFSPANVKTLAEFMARLEKQLVMVEASEAARMDHIRELEAALHAV